ncbi:hypothetical protein [Caulifigura coniformis]|uniref:hypothetical protein n=1 Tax=Caulifigura coniformis TaxID=2527983 RepID=UPI0011A4B11C|nr:hypothetical protein [Caulifigura coniformis]
METRILPAAIATASKTTLNITGDAEAGSNLQLEQISGGVRLTALSGTIRVNGADVTSADFTGITTLNVRLGAGDDTVSVLGSLNLKNVTFNLGDGDNSLSVGAGMNVTGKLSVTGGTGDDTVSFEGSIAKSASISLGLGNDQISLLGTSFSSSVTINTGAGADLVTIDETSLGVDASFNNTLTINTGEDNDEVSIRNAATKRITLNTGDDDDIVDLENITANGTLSLQTGAGADILNLVSVTQTASGTNTINVGTGADAVVIAQSSLKANTNIDLGTGIINTLSVDDTSFAGTFNLNTNGGVQTGVGDVINIETNTSLVGGTVFSKAAKLKVGAAADINLGLLEVSSDTDFLSTLSITGINPVASLEVAADNIFFATVPNLSKVLRTDLV